MEISWRSMDTDNGGIEWTEWNTLEVGFPEEGTNAEDAAKAVNQATHIWCQGGLDKLPEDEREAPGALLAARGGPEHGIAWFEDRGHQGATTIILEWHQRIL